MTLHSKFTEMELEKQADDIMDRFAFEKVHAHMVATGHQWYMGDAGMRIPEIDEIKVQARRLLTSAIYSHDHCTNHGTGGFVAYKMPWGMQLTFQLAWA